MQLRVTVRSWSWRSYSAVAVLSGEVLLLQVVSGEINGGGNLISRS